MADINTIINQTTDTPILLEFNSGECENLKEKCILLNTKINLVAHDRTKNKSQKDMYKLSVMQGKLVKMYGELNQFSYEPEMDADSEQILLAEPNDSNFKTKKDIHDARIATVKKQNNQLKKLQEQYENILESFNTIEHEKSFLEEVEEQIQFIDLLKENVDISHQAQIFSVKSSLQEMYGRIKDEYIYAENIEQINIRDNKHKTYTGYTDDNYAKLNLMKKNSSKAYKDYIEDLRTSLNQDIEKMRDTKTFLEKKSKRIKDSAELKNIKKGIERLDSMLNSHAGFIKFLNTRQYVLANISEKSLDDIKKLAGEINEQFSKKKINTEEIGKNLTALLDEMKDVTKGNKRTTILPNNNAPLYNNPINAQREKSSTSCLGGVKKMLRIGGK